MPFDRFETHEEMFLGLLSGYGTWLMHNRWQWVDSPIDAFRLVITWYNSQTCLRGYFVNIPVTIDLSRHRPKISWCNIRCRLKMGTNDNRNSQRLRLPRLCRPPSYVARTQPRAWDPYYPFPSCWRAISNWSSWCSASCSRAEETQSH